MMSRHFHMAMRNGSNGRLRMEKTCVGRLGQRHVVEHLRSPRMKMDVLQVESSHIYIYIHCIKIKCEYVCMYVCSNGYVSVYNYTHM